MNTATNKLLTIIAADDQISKQMDQIAANAENKLGGIGDSAIGLGALLGSTFGGAGAVIGAVLGGLLTLAKRIFNAIAQAARWAALAATAAFEEFVRRSTHNALILQGSYIGLAAVARSLGIPGSELEKNIQATRKLGIEWGGAVQSLTYWLQIGLPLDRFQAAARAAQDVAKAFPHLGTSTEVFRDFINAMQSGWTENLRKYGLYMPMEQLVRQYAPAPWKGANVNEVPQQIKQLTILNMLMEKAGLFAGGYENAIKRAVGALSSLARYWDEIKNTVGVYILEPLYRIIRIVTDFVEALIAANEQGRGLASIFRWIGAVVRTLFSDISNGKTIMETLQRATEAVFNPGTLQTFIKDMVVLKIIWKEIKFGIMEVMLYFRQLMLGWKQIRYGLSSDEAKKALKEVDEAKKAIDRAELELGAAKREYKIAPERALKHWMDSLEEAKKALDTFRDGAKGAAKSTEETSKAMSDMGKTFGGGERFARYSQALGYRMTRQGFAPIQVTVNGSPSYVQGAKDMAGTLGDALSQQLADQFPTGLAGSGA